MNIKLKMGSGLIALLGAFAVQAQTVVESFEYATTEDLTAVWTGSANAVVSASDVVATTSSGTKSMRVDFTFPSVAYTTEFVSGTDLPAPIVIAPEKYVSFRIKGDPAFSAADFRSLYLYAYDEDGNFGRWGAPVPKTDGWQVFNFLAGTVEKPWNSTQLPDLSRIVRFAFYQYGSELAIPAYSATIYVDDVTVRDSPLVEVPAVRETVVDTFEYATTAELAAAWKGSANATVSSSDAVSSGSTGTKAMKVDFNFPSIAFTTETVTGPDLAAPVPIAASQYVSFRIKGDPAFAAADFRNLYVYAYDVSGNFGRWGAAVPVTADWQVFNFKADTIEKPWNSASLPNLGAITRFAFYQYGSEAEIPAYSAAIYVDDLQIRDTPLANPPPVQERIVETFEYASDDELIAAWTGAANTVVSRTEEDAPNSTGQAAMKLEFFFPSGEWATDSVSGPLLENPVSIGAAQYVTFRVKGDPAFATADFKNLYLYVYDGEGNFGRWGAPVPVTDDWKVSNFSAASLEQPWNSPGKPNLSQIVRFAFFQYGSQAAIPEYSATISVDDISIRNTPLTEFPAPAVPRVLIDDFEGYADATALQGFYTYRNSPAATATTVSLGSPAPQGGKTLKLAVDFAAGQYPWGSVESAPVAPFSFPTNAVVSFKLKGDPNLAAVADAATSFWLTFYDASGRPMNYVTTAAPVSSGEWSTLQATLADFGDTTAVDVGNLVRWRILLQGWQGTAEHPAGSGVVEVDDIRIAVPVPPAIQVSGVPPAGLTGAPFTSIVVDEANQTVTAVLPANGTQGFLTITPAQEIKSVTVTDGKLIVRW